MGEITFYFEIFGKIIRQAIEDYRFFGDKMKKGLITTEEIPIYTSAKKYLFDKEGLETVFNKLPPLNDILSLEAIRDEANKQEKEELELCLN